MDAIVFVMNVLPCCLFSASFSHAIQWTKRYYSR